MIKYIRYIKDLFFVVDDFHRNGQRISESMITNSLVLLSSVLIGFGIIPTGFTDEEIMAVGTGVYALVNMWLRLRSQGGQIKLRGDVGAKLRNADKPPDDEHGIL